MLVIGVPRWHIRRIMINPESHNSPRDIGPEEGIDYLIDYYAVLDLPHTASAEEVSERVRRIVKQNHPDRLHGMDESLVAQGERKTELANRAKQILGDENNRHEYDEIFAQWDGLVSLNGGPVDSPDVWEARMARKMSHVQLEQSFETGRQKIEEAVGYSAKRLAMLRKFVDGSEGDVEQDVRDEYDAALLAQDKALSIEQAQRSANLGMGDEVQVVGFGFAEAIEPKIKQGREASMRKAHEIEAANVKGRLALMAGAGVEPIVTSTELTRTQAELPDWFDAQAEKVCEIAARREKLLHERLANMTLTYPEMEMQQEARDKFILGISMSAQTMWLGFSYDHTSNSANQVDIDDVTQRNLNEEQFAAVVEAGYNVAKFDPLEEVDIMTVLEAALGKHVEKYYENTPSS